MAVYTNSTPSRNRHGTPPKRSNAVNKSRRSITFKMANLRTRIRPSSVFTTAERLFGTGWPEFGAALGVDYDQTSITKVDRIPATGK